MRRVALLGFLALLLAAGAAAKAPPSGIELCGSNGCSTIAAQAAEQLFQNGGGPASVAPAPFFSLRWSWDDGGRDPSGGYWVPQANAVRFPGSGWSGLLPGAAALLQAAASGLEPLAPAPPDGATVGGRVAADAASYARLLSEGTRVSTWAGARDWIPVRLVSARPTPWTGGSFDLRISKARGFVWRDGAVYRIPLALARLARGARSLAPAPAPAGFAPVGARGCEPASPRAAAEVFGTATGTRLWALLFLPAGSSWASATDAALTRAVGKDVKIVLRFGAATFRLQAVGPGGAQVEPDWGPTRHASSHWRRPGAEWAVGYTFPAPGCWRIHAGDGTVAGDLWLEVVS